MVGCENQCKDAGARAGGVGWGGRRNVVRSCGNLAFHAHNFPSRKYLGVGDQAYIPHGFPLDRPTFGCQSPRSTRGGGPCGFHLECLVRRPCVVSYTRHTYPCVHVRLTLCIHRRETPACPGSKDSLLGSHPSWTISCDPTTEPGASWPLEVLLLWLG